MKNKFTKLLLLIFLLVLLGCSNTVPGNKNIEVVKAKDVNFYLHKSLEKSDPSHVIRIYAGKYQTKEKNYLRIVFRNLRKSIKKEDFDWTVSFNQTLLTAKGLEPLVFTFATRELGLDTGDEIEGYYGYASDSVLTEEKALEIYRRLLTNEVSITFEQNDKPQNKREVKLTNDEIQGLIEVILFIYPDFQKNI